MDWNKLVDAFWGSPEPLRFSEHNGEVHYDENNIAPVGEIVTDFANLIMEKRLEQKYNNLVSLICETQDTILKSGDKLIPVYTVARKYGGHAFSYTIFLIAHEAYYNGAKPFADYFGDTIKELCLACRKFVYGKKLRTVNPFPLEADISTDKNGTLQIEYTSSSPVSIVFFHLFRLQESGIHPNICKVCGRAFLPVSKSTEMYCRKPYNDGRLCADVAFDNRSKNDPFYSLYRKAYKTMSARAARMIDGGGQEKLSKWRILAKEKLEEYRTSGDLAGFQDWLSDSKK